MQFARTKKRAVAMMKLGPQLQVEISSDFQSKTVQNAGLECYVGKFCDQASAPLTKTTSAWRARNSCKWWNC